MNCLSFLKCCCPTYSHVDEATQLVARRQENRGSVSADCPLDDHAVEPQIVRQGMGNLPSVHVSGVSSSFVTKLTNCRTTPVPTLGSYHVPFPAVKSVHIFQASRSTLKIVVFQDKPYGTDYININLHHAFFPNYKERNDPGEKSQYVVDISNIQSNGDRLSDLRLRVLVHDGRFSPQLESLTVVTDDRPTIVSAVIQMPKFGSEHLYYRIRKIEMLNVIPSPEIVDMIRDDQTIDQIITLIIFPDLKTQIDTFLSEKGISSI